MPVIDLISQHARESAIGGGFSVLIWVIAFPLRTTYNKLKDEWNSKSALLVEVRAELVQQRTNCLATLQNQGSDQVKLLEKSVETLEKIHLSQAEMTGYLKAL